jgi:hypothetical protein
VRVGIRAAGVAAILVVALSAGCGGGGDKSTNTTRAPIPKTLADGTKPAPMPTALRRFRGRKVIAAKELPGVAAELSCAATGQYEGRVNTIGGWISPEGLAVGYSVNGANQLYSCDALYTDGHWKRCAETVLELKALSAEELTREEKAAVCDDSAFMWVAGVPNAAWGLVDHGTYWVAYLAVNKPLLRISLNSGFEGDSRSSIVFTDDRGRVVISRAIEDGKVVG